MDLEKNIIKSFIPVNEPLIGEREKELVNECLNTGWVSSEGPFVEEFEEKFSNLVNRKFGISCSNGTAALEIAVKALNIGPGDEVILPSFTIISCSNAIVKCGAKPIPVDVNPETWTMEIDQVNSAINSKTKAIMAVHIYGLPVDIDPLINLAKLHNLFLIEDAAEMIGGDYKGKPCGSFGDISTVSFYPNKTITTGEGGMILTNDKNIAQRCSSLRNLCFQPEKRFVHEEIGWNYRMSNIQAALGLAQLERIREIIKKKIWIGQLYDELLGDIDQFNTQSKVQPYSRNIYWVYGITVKKDFGNSEKIRSCLSKFKIGSRPFFYPIHLQPIYLKMNIFKKNLSLPVSEFLYEQGFYIPSGIALNEEQIRSVSYILKKIIREI